MSSRNKRKIARKNGAQAAGTKSPEGIKKSSMNALRHGLTGKALVLTNESESQFNALMQSYIDRFQPEDDVEMDLIDQIVAAQWRLRRIWCMQTAALDLKMDHQEEEIAKTFNHIDQATRTTVAFTAMANEERFPRSPAALRNSLQPDVRPRPKNAPAFAARPPGFSNIHEITKRTQSRNHRITKRP